PCGERSNRGRSFLERDEPPDAAWWNRGSAVRVRAFRLPRMATRCAATTRDAAPSSDREPACDAEVLYHRRRALPGAGPGRRGSRALQGRRRKFLWHRYFAHLSKSDSPHLASAARDPMDRHRVFGRWVVHRAVARGTRSSLSVIRGEPALC